MGPRKQIILIAGGFLVIALLGLFVRHIDGPRVIVKIVAPDGTEFCVVQKCNWDGEMFTTSCYSRKPGGAWGWFYYDHQDWYWGRARVVVDPHAKRINIHRSGKVVITFDWEMELLRRLRNGFPERESLGPQDMMPIGWEIGQR